jgi:small subunit ribosomal protein S9
MAGTSHIWGLGRRKTGAARVRIAPGTGTITVNGRPVDEYFPVERLRKMVRIPLEVSDTAGRYDIHVNATGGGVAGQVGACIMGISRALVQIEPAAEASLRKHGLLTRDSRMVERKKYGKRGARRGTQFSKR